MVTIFFLLLPSAVLCSWTYPSHYRRFFPMTKYKNWPAAQMECRENYTDLVTVHSKEEEMKISNSITIVPGDSLWIGLRRTNSGLKWSSGDDINYINHAPDGRREEPYCYSMKTDGRWDKVECDKRRAFMCYSQGDGEDPPRYTPYPENLSWCEAQTFCRVHHTDLVSISSQTQNDEVKNYGTGHAPFWIGLKNDTWEWSDGDCSTFRDWRYTEPGVGQNCVTMGSYQNLPFLSAHNCSHTGKHALCYRDEIYLINITMTWEQALSYCNQNHSGLLRIESPQDQRHLEAYLRKRTPLSGHVWLGLRQSRLFGFWIWTNGQNVGWSNWERGSQPEQPLSHVCGAIATSGPGKYKWSDQNCLSERYFLCEGEGRLN